MYYKRLISLFSSLITLKLQVAKLLSDMFFLFYAFNAFKYKSTFYFFKFQNLRFYSYDCHWYINVFNHVVFNVFFILFILFFLQRFSRLRLPPLQSSSVIQNTMHDSSSANCCRKSWSVWKKTTTKEPFKNCVTLRRGGGRRSQCDTILFIMLRHARVDSLALADESRSKSYVWALMATYHPLGPMINRVSP